MDRRRLDDPIVRGSCGMSAVLGAVLTDRAGVSDLTGFRHRLTARTPWLTPSDPKGSVIRQHRSYIQASGLSRADPSGHSGHDPEGRVTPIPAGLALPALRP
jgi:hypothetical protein